MKSYYKLLILVKLFIIITIIINYNQLYSINYEYKYNKNISTNEFNIQKKVYFSFLTTYNFSERMSNLFSFNEFLYLKTKGVFNIDDFATTSALHNYYKKYGPNLIDPFPNGEIESTMIQKKYTPVRLESEKIILFKETMKGSNINYITNKEDLFLLIFAGPDGDIDNDNIDFNKFNLKGYQNIRSHHFNQDQWVIPKINHPDIIQYDPTNGLYSNGDIIWPIKIKTLGEYDKKLKTLKIGEISYPLDSPPISNWIPIYDLNDKD
jgi:hypothetical protein